jgi:hypothetical protein
MVLVFPSACALATFVLLLLAVELQVRFVEEPYLVRVHGDAYTAYSARVGRFLPGIGRGATGSGVAGSPSVRAFSGAVVGASVVAVVTIVPPAEWGRVGEPTWFAIVAFLLSVALAVAVEIRPAPRLERIWFAAFLAGMPGICIATALRAGESAGIEWLGLAIFGACAIAGLRRPAFLAWGIAAHGLLWDALHVGRSSFMPDWYAVVCLIADVSLGLWLAARPGVDRN